MWPSRSALSLALFLRTPPDEPFEIARWLATAHHDADAQRTHAQEQLERHTLARCTHRLPPILSRAPTRMDACPQQLLPAGPELGFWKGQDFENHLGIYHDFPKCMFVPRVGHRNHMIMCGLVRFKTSRSVKTHTPFRDSCLTSGELLHRTLTKHSCQSSS